MWSRCQHGNEYYLVFPYSMFFQLGEWLWLDNTAVNFVNWNVGEPSPQQNEHCVEMYANSGYWNNIYCSSYKGYVCKKPKSKCCFYEFVLCMEYAPCVLVLVDGSYTQCTLTGCFEVF